jgi:hypothetical protein
MITKIDASKIEYQLNGKTFVWNCDNLIENKPKQIQKTNLKLTNY